MTRQALNEALKDSMKARDARATSTLRMVLAKLKDKDIEARPSGNSSGIDEPAVLAVLQGMVKQRRESIELYRQGGRQDLVDAETAEIAVIERFLPQPLDEAATAAAIQAVIGEIGAGGIKDMGRTMAALRERFAGRMDFGKASGLVKAALATQS
ncbi:MAG TPA: GatB/YqeY domain-containing protein [Stellaceae bacterium]|nr:GatB/YqeY domain-containing protein [Stellaceae bacterium]